MNYSYYYNQVPGQHPQRNNLIYTSLISDDQKTFVKWFYNDTEYHQDQNEVVDPDKMEEKWQRELKYLTLMNEFYSKHTPKILDIHHKEKKIFLEIDGADFWNRAKCQTHNYNNVLPDWQSQMLEILKAHRSLDLYKYSMHPSSYFIVEGQLKSVNYFFCYHKNEGPISIADHSSHIHSNRQKIMRDQVEAMGLDWHAAQPLSKLQELCFESFRTNYPAEFIEKAKEIYRD
jgi:hypothetical protein